MLFNYVLQRREYMTLSGIYLISINDRWWLENKMRIKKFSFYPQHTFPSRHMFLPDIRFHSISYYNVNGNPGCWFRQYKINTNQIAVNR